MREIKFRAWVDETSKWNGAKDIGMFTGFTFIDYSSGYDEANLYCEDGRKIEEPQWNKIVLMQFTGLKDKNGKEIYEGDIVRMLYTDWGDEEKGKHNGTVEMKEDRWMLNFGKSRFGDDDFGTLKPGAHGYMEVIGNIYENKELLK